MPYIYLMSEIIYYPICILSYFLGEGFAGDYLEIELGPSSDSSFGTGVSNEVVI